MFGRVRGKVIRTMRQIELNDKGLGIKGVVLKGSSSRHPNPT